MDTVDSLVMQHQDYVRSLARGIARKLPRHVDFEELVSLGQVGLISAAKQYEPGRGVAFATFAYYRIRGAIFDGLRQLTGLPPSVRRQVARMGGENEVAETTAETSEGSDDPEFLAKQFETAIGRLGAVFLLSRGTGGEDEGELEPVDERSAADVAESREAAALVLKAVERLTPEQRELIRLLYFEQRSMTDVAQSMKKNKSTISRRHAEAIDALRAMLSPEQKQGPPPAVAAPIPPPPGRRAGAHPFPLPSMPLPPLPPRPG